MKIKNIIYVMIIFGITFLMFLSIYGLVDARAGGGGGGGGGNGDGDGGVIGLAIAGIYYAIYTIRRNKMIAKAKKDLQEALNGDSSWDLNLLNNVVRETFLKYQEARMDKNLGRVEHLMTKNYFVKANEILKNKLNGKKNILKNISIENLTLMAVRDYSGRDGDMFAMEVEASMIDYTIDEFSGKFIVSTLRRLKNEKNADYEERAMRVSSSFKEYYIFVRFNNKWILNNIKNEFSIIKDVIGLSESELKRILKQEELSDDVDNSELFRE